MYSSGGVWAGLTSRVSTPVNGTRPPLPPSASLLAASLLRSPVTPSSDSQHLTVPSGHETTVAGDSGGSDNHYLKLLSAIPSPPPTRSAVGRIDMQALQSTSANNNNNNNNSPAYHWTDTTSALLNSSLKFTDPFDEVCFFVLPT